LVVITTKIRLPTKQKLSNPTAALRLFCCVLAHLVLLMYYTAGVRVADAMLCVHLLQCSWSCESAVDGDELH
jgi:hypothetical protein